MTTSFLEEAQVEFSRFDHGQKDGQDVVRDGTRGQQTRQSNFTPPLPHFTNVDTIEKQQSILHNNNKTKGYLTIVEHANNKSFGCFVNSRLYKMNPT